MIPPDNPWDNIGPHPDDLAAAEHRGDFERPAEFDDPNAWRGDLDYDYIRDRHKSLRRKMMLFGVLILAFGVAYTLFLDHLEVLNAM